MHCPFESEAPAIPRGFLTADFNSDETEVERRQEIFRFQVCPFLVRSRSPPVNVVALVKRESVVLPPFRSLSWKRLLHPAELLPRIITNNPG